MLLIDELRTNHDSLAQSLGSAEYRDVLLVIEIAHEKPEIRFSEFSLSSGVEIIEKARGHHDIH